jgi:dTDP-glucose 4,6-dehydratase
MKTKILLTGCAGFIGSNFVKTIASKNSDYEFVILDALTYAGHFPTIQKEIEENNHLSFINMDIRDNEKINELFEKEKFSGVIHFAAESHVDNSIKNPNIFIETNVLGTLNLLNASLNSKSQDFKFVHVSTDEVYGSLLETDSSFTEEDPIKPNSPYSASKASSDLLAVAYFKTFNLPVCITRCSNNYGPYQFPEKLIPLMIDNALKGIPLPVYGDGKNIRDWIFVDDHNDGIWATFLKGKPGEIYNFGGAAEKRNIEVVKTLLTILGKAESLISFVEDRKGHDWRYAVNFEKATKELGWFPKVTFEKGIKLTADWYVKNQKWCKEVML